MKNRLTILFAASVMVMGLVACQVPSDAVGMPEQVTLMLDWVPNTNHTGFFVAQDLGYFTEAGLDVRIIEPGEVFAEQAVSAGVAEFGISFQEQVTIARDQDIPLVSVAAIIQQNSSAFASRAELGASSPEAWEGLRYGSFGSPFEEPTLRVLMDCAGGDFDQVVFVETGYSDPLALLSEAQIDMAWIFYGWQGIQAELQSLELNLVMMADWQKCIPDYYTPVLITSETLIAEQPDLVRAFLHAVARGYAYAIADPAAAADILLRAVPELDRDLVQRSQAWISPRYRADASRWGEQDIEVWDGYTKWMVENGIIQSPIQSNDAMTNEFLP